MQFIVTASDTITNSNYGVVADDGIKAEDLPRLRAFIKDRAQILLEEIDNWISQLDVPDPQSDKVIKTGLGIYHFVAEEEEKE